MTDIKPDLTITDLPDPRPSDPIEALSWLGETEEEVVASLRERGIKGKINGLWSCPVHNYLLEFGLDFTVCERYIRPRSSLDQRDEICNPKGITAFIRAFDGHAYPDLIDNG